MDTSFALIVEDISVINNDLSNIKYNLNNLDLSFATDASFLELEDKINNLDPANFNEIINDVSQTYYTISTQQPYKFDTSGLLSIKIVHI